MNLMKMIINTGVAVGAGWQAVVAYVNIVCYYVFGIPFGLLLGYKLNFGVMVINESLNLLFQVKKKKKTRMKTPIMRKSLMC